MLLVLSIKENVWNFMVNFHLRNIFSGNLNEAVSTNEIASFKFQIFLKRKLTYNCRKMDFPFISVTPVIGFESYLTFYYHFFLRIPFQLFFSSSSLILTVKTHSRQFIISLF